MVKKGPRPLLAVHGDDRDQHVVMFGLMYISGYNIDHVFVPERNSARSTANSKEQATALQHFAISKRTSVSHACSLRRCMHPARLA